MFERIYTILPSEAGAGGAMKPRGIVNCLQDTADMAVAELGADTQSVLNNGHAWLLVQGNMSVAHTPQLGEKIIVRTWHNVSDTLYTFRAFEIDDAFGARIASGSTSWMLIDLSRGRPVKPRLDFLKKFAQNGRENPPVVCNFVTLPRTSDCECANEKFFEVRTHDLDANNHVNNSAYIEWAVEALPSVYALSKKLTGWDVTYRKSASYGDVISVKSFEDDDDTKTVTAMMSAGDNFLCTVRTYWGD